MFWRRKPKFSPEELTYLGWMVETNGPCEGLVMDEYAVYGDDVVALMDWGRRAGPEFRSAMGEFQRSAPPTARLGTIRDLYVSSMMSFERCADLWARADIEGAVQHGNSAVDLWEAAVSAVERLR